VAKPPLILLHWRASKGGRMAIETPCSRA
jgi:hypothetical protein